MTPQLEMVMTAARALPMQDKLALLEAVSHDLQQTYRLTEVAAQFWRPQSIEDLATAQAAPVITDVHSLAVDFWPADESADDVNQFIATQRQANRLRRT